MTARPFFVKLAAFCFAFAAALMLVGEIRHVQNRIALDERLRSSPASRPFYLLEDMDVEVGLVTLDREHSRSYTRLRLSAYRGRVPDKLWVRTYFFSPDDAEGRVWANDSVEISRPFDELGSVNLTVAAPCGWCDDEGIPNGGYFARVQIFDGSDMTPLPVGASFADIRTAVPVVVHAERLPVTRR